MLALAVFPPGAASADSPPCPRPNIVVILADDLGWSDLSCYGSAYHRTPAIDSLAAQGAKFTNSYAAAAICSPTRASLLTGKYPARLHLTHIVQAAPARLGKLRDPDWTPYVGLDEITLAETLRGAGYATGIIGKWHLGGAPGRSATGDGAEGDPTRQGFDLYRGGNSQGQTPDYFFPYRRAYANGTTYGLENLEGGREGEYLTDRLTLEAEKFIDEHHEKPFFLLLAHFAPHTSMGDRLQAKPATIANFQRTATPNGLQRDPVYAAMLASLDESVGRVLEKLAQLGIAEKTLVIFTSDNGGVEGKTSNLPLRGAKQTPYEGGLRVPTIIRWPGKIAPEKMAPGKIAPGKIGPGRVIEQPICTPDFYSTVVEAAGAVPQATPLIDGRSLVPLVCGDGHFERDAIYWHYPHCDTEPYSIVRRGNFKLIEFLADGRLELFDLKADPGEEHNLAVALSDKATELREDLARWRESVGAQMPLGE